MADEALEISINQVDYIAGSGCPTLYVFGRDKDGKSHTVEVNGFMPYFYVVPEDAARIDPKRAIPDLYTDFHTIKGLLVRKIYTKNPRDIRDIRDRYTHFEADINYGQRFLIDCGIYGGMKTSSLRPHFTQVQNSDILTPLRTCIIDIECNDERGFPEANKDEIICITCWDSFTDSYTSFIYKPYDAIQSIDQCVPPEPLESGCFKSQHHFIQNYHSEYEMMRGFVAFIQNLDPDVISGWNVDQFDMPYIQGRLQALKIPPEGLGRIYGRTSPDRIRGRLVFDLLMGYKKLQRAALESYRLDAVAEAELGEKKVRYTGTLCDLWKKTPDKLLEYNYKDVQLCVGINKKNHIIDFYREIARYVGCPLDRTLASSQVIDTYILRKANGTYVLPSRNEAATSEMFEGATVLTPSKGLRENVVVFDLKSLYPMIMMTINASLETKDPHGEIYAPDGTRFKKEPDGLTRSLLSDLLTQRDEKKRIRNTFPHGSEEYHLYDMQQEVLKVIMNTYYGVSGFPKFRLYDREIGAAVTSTGRAIIDFTKNLMEEMGHKVVYGDSVSGDSKITLYDGKKQFLSHGNIENLFTHVDHVSEDGKEYCNLQGIYTDTIDEKGIARIKPVPYIMRHKTNKQMYRVQMTNQWYVDVTEDHSLFGYESKNQKLLPHERIVPVKPTELGSNIKSLIVKKSSHRNIERSMRYPKELYELMGYFIGCGSFNVKYGEKNYYIYLSGGNDVEEIITKILEPLKNSGHILNYWRKKKGDLCINGPIVQIFNEYIHSKEGKTIPKIIYDETVENIRAFVRGLFSSDGTCMMRNKSPIVRYCSIHKHLCEEIQSILHLIGIASSISRDNTENSYLGKYSGTWSHYVLIKSIREFATNVRFIEDRKNNNLDLIFDKFDKKHKIKELDIDITQIQSIEKIDHGEYVYDIEVEDTHRFFANNILVHNTDSVLCELGLEIKDLDDLIAKSKVIEKILNKSYDIFARDQLHVDKHFFSTKFEKVYRRFFQAGKKKRYAGHLVWKEGVVADKIDIVGFETKRSDTPKLSKKVLEKIIVLLLNGSDHATVKGYIKEVIRNYRKGVYPLEEIGIPSGITKDFKEYKNNDIRVRSAKYSNTYLHTDFKKGSKPKRIYVKQITGRKYPPTDVLSFEFADQVPPEFEVDYELMLNKTLRDPIIRMVESLGWTWESIDPSCSTLEMFGIQ